MDFATLAHTLGLDWKVFIFQLVNALLVLYVLRRYAFGPIMKIIDDRKAFASEAEAKMQLAQAELEKSRESGLELEQVARAKYQELIESGKLDGKKAYEQLVEMGIAQASESKAAILFQAERDAENIKKQTLTEFKELLVASTSKIIKGEVDSKSIATKADRMLQ